MYGELLEDGERTLIVSRRVRAESESLRTRTSVVLLTYCRHRLLRMAGSSDADGFDRVRRVLHDFLCDVGWPKIWIGFSRGAVCQACGSAIKPNDRQYDVEAGPSELRLDSSCFTVLNEVLRGRSMLD